MAYLFICELRIFLLVWSRTFEYGEVNITVQLDHWGSSQ
jgi:hypothetical protein